MFLHELAHIQRADWPMHLMGRLACIAYWFHPLVWIAARKAREESERACDDAVLRAGEKPADYAQRLIDVVRRMPENPTARTIALAMVEQNEVENRLHAILAKGVRRGGTTRKRLVAAGAILCIVLVPLATLRLVAHAEGNRTKRQGQGLIEEITPEGYRGTWYNGAKLLIHTAIHDQVPVASGHQVTLANGFTVRLLGITQGVRDGDKWRLYGGPWWDASGVPLKKPLYKPFVSDEPTRKHGDSVPTCIVAQLLPPSEDRFMVAGVPYPKQEISIYGESFDLAPLIEGRMESPIARTEGAFASTGMTFFYPADARSCTVRVGVGTGPWRTAATLPLHLSPTTIPKHRENSAQMDEAAGIKMDDKPALIYQTVDGKDHTEYFLGENGQLGNVARRIVAVDFSGQTRLLATTGGYGTKWVIPAGGLFFHGCSAWDLKYNPNGDISRIKELRLETRPYQIVEFRDVPLHMRGR